MSSRFAALPIWGVFLASLVPAMPGCTGPAAADEDVGASEHVGTSKEALVLPVGSTEINAVLGQGYDVAQQAFKGQCVRSDTTLPAGQPSVQTFTNGIVLRHPDFGTHAVPLAIAERYAALGGALGPWGYPVEDVRTGASGHVWQSFHRGGFPGAIHHRVGVGAFETIGAVHAKYKELADLRITLGAPLANEVVRNGGVVQTFEDGVIVVRNGAFVVSGSIYGKWLELGTEARFGWPVSAFKPRGSSGCQDFTSGVICQSAMLGRQVVAEVYGNVLARWTQLGRETGTVGFPITGESAFPSGRGRYNEFANGAVVQSPGVAGALHVEEKVFEEWRKSGFDRGCLGFPIEELRAQDVTLPGFRVRNVKAQRFQGGFMVVRDPVPGDRDHRERPEVHCR